MVRLNNVRSGRLHRTIYILLLFDIEKYGQEDVILGTNYRTGERRKAQTRLCTLAVSPCILSWTKSNSIKLIFHILLCMFLFAKTACYVTSRFNYHYFALDAKLNHKCAKYVIPLFHTGHESPELPRIDFLLIRGDS